MLFVQVILFPVSPGKCSLVAFSRLICFSLVDSFKAEGELVFIVLFRGPLLLLSGHLLRLCDIFVTESICSFSGNPFFKSSLLISVFGARLQGKRCVQCCCYCSIFLYLHLSRIITVHILFTTKFVLLLKLLETIRIRRILFTCSISIYFFHSLKERLLGFLSEWGHSPLGLYLTWNIKKNFDL